MTIKDIIENYLNQNGYDGLCNIDCGCDLTYLIPCDGEYIINCQPAYKHYCKICKNKCNKSHFGFCYKPERQI